MKRSLVPSLLALTVLSITCSVRAQPANDNCAGAIVIANHSVTPFDTTGATSTGPKGCSLGASYLDLWYQYTTAGAEQVTVNLCGSAISPDANTTTMLTVYSGLCGASELSCVRNSVCSSNLSQVVFQTSGVGTYFIAVGLRSTSGHEVATGMVNLESVPVAPPSNDTCAGAYVVGDGNTWVNNSFATQDTLTACIPNAAPRSGADVWYSYTAPASGLRNFEVTRFHRTTGASRDNVLTIYDGCGGIVLGCDDNSGVSVNAKVYHLPVTAGSIYKVRLSNIGNTTATGLGILTISAPRTPAAIDDCALAAPFSGQGAFPFTTAGLTNSDTQGWDCEASERDGWIAWTPTASGIGVVSACAATGVNGLTLSLYESCGSAPLICNSLTFQDPPNTCPAKFCHPVVACQTYFVRFGLSLFYTDAGGDMQFEVRPAGTGISIPAGALVEPGNCNDAPSADVNGGCNVTPPAFTQINLCDTRSGTASARLLPVQTSFANGSPREPAMLTVDQDWYEFTLASDQAVTITGQSEFIPRREVRFACPGTVISGPSVATPTCGGTYTLDFTTAVLVAGTYYFRITPVDDFPLPLFTSSCGNGDRYWFKITGAAPCMPPTVTCCRGTTCLSVAAGSCTGTVDGSASVAVGSCGSGGALATCCYADYDHSGTSNIDDLFIYINSWLAVSPYTKIAGDGVAVPSIDDLFVFINLWLAGCV